MIKTILKVDDKFRSDDDGAVTVDWVVLVAAIVGLAIPIVALIYSGMDIAAGTINDSVGSMSITSY